MLAEIQDFSNWQFRLEARVQTEYIRPQKIPIQTGIDPRVPQPSNALIQGRGCKRFARNLNERILTNVTAAAYASAKACHKKNAWVNDKVNLYTPGEAKNWGVFEVNNRVGAAGQP